MSEEKKIQGPSTEEEAIRGVAGALQRAEYAAEKLREIPITIGNLEQLQSTISWLEGVSENLRKEHSELRVKLAPKPPQVD